jgi:large subunit ribosomal protein L32
MAVPKRKNSNSRSGKRRSHHFKTPRQLNSCPKCSTMVPSHVVCPDCGYYMGRVVVTQEEDQKAGA